MYGQIEKSYDAPCTTGQSYQQPSQRQQLQQKKDALESELAKVNAAIEALDAHPDLEKFIDTINRAR